MISVLVVDDSAVVRRLIADAIDGTSDIEVVGTAGNGRLAQGKIDQLKPDVVTMDIEMPDMDGIQAVRELRKRHPRLPVIMFSTLSAAGASATLEALAAGATDYVTKPSHMGSVAASIAAIRDQLIPRIHALARRQTPNRPIGPPPGSSIVPGRPGLNGGFRRSSGAPPVDRPGPAGNPTGRPGAQPGAAQPGAAQPGAAQPGAAQPGGVRSGGARSNDAAALGASAGGAAGGNRASAAAAAGRGGGAAQVTPRPGGRPSGRIDVLAVGCSTGGPDALTSVLQALPTELPVPVLVTQHMPPLFTKMFAERLDRGTPLTVVEAVDGMPLAPGTVYIAPGDHHLMVQRRGTATLTQLSSAPPENSCRPAVDVMFRSLASVFGAAVYAVVLTGMGQDGRAGAQLLRAAGAEVLAQDEASSVVWGMPGAVVGAGLADAVLPLDRIAQALLARVSMGRMARAVTR